ncbi:MAG TPA: BTAD domain-containing putative transcriptional regulator, partial [Solirubrobacterales bacterium]|nr:BTAD domain-containing putative transcriptional regulator [Solirubrobacterales bacterium]
MTRRPGYVLRVEPGDLDAWQFERLLEEGHRALAAGRPVRASERLQAALGLWRGAAYGELSTEPFAMAEVARLEEARLVAVENLVDADLGLGRHASQVGRLEALVGEHPYRERLWGKLMLALYRSGRQAEALRAFGRVRQLLGDELGIEPSAPLRALEEDILLQKHHLDWAGPLEEATPASSRRDANGNGASTAGEPKLDGAAASPDTRSVPDERMGGEPTGAAPGRGLRTFLLTDIEGSTALWEREPVSMATAVGRHDALVAEVVRSSGGRLIKARGEGDSTFAVFELASAATIAAARLGQAFADESWPTGSPVRIRMGLMTGEAEERGGDFFGGMVNRAARLRSLALGGEIMLSESVAALVADDLPPGTAIVDRGWQSLRDLHRPEHVFQLRLDAEEVPEKDDAASSDLSWMPSMGRSFVGRSGELRLLREAWSRAAAGERSLVLVAGEPGIGKTRLAAELAQRIHADGGLVLYGHWEEEALWPFQAVREALSRYGRSGSRATLRAELGEGVRELARLLPELTERIGGGTPLRADPDTERYRLFEAVDGWLTEAASRRPLLLVLDDLHWADRPSLLLLQHLMRGTASSSLMVLATYCHTEVHPGSDVWAALAGFRRMTGFQRVSLQGLATAEVGDFVQQMAAQPPIPAMGLADLLQEETGGNPFFLSEIVRHLLELGVVGPNGLSRPSDAIEVPESVHEVVQARLARLSPTCRKALTAAAVIGAEFDLQVVGAASGIDDDALVEGFEEALAAGVVVEGSGGGDHYSFAHSVVRKTVYDELSQSRLARLHYRIALALEGSRATGRPHVAELAYHFGQGVTAGGADKALEYARRAAEQAVREVAYEAAARQYRRAIELLDGIDPTATALRAELLLALGDAHNRAGEVAAGAEEFLEAAEAARALDRPELLAEAALGLGGVLPAAVRPDPRAQALLEEALTRLGTSDSRSRAVALGRLAQRMHHASSREDRAALCEEAVPMARRLSDPATLAAVLTSRYWALDGPDDLDGRLRTATEIVRLGEDLDDHEVVLHGLKASLHVRFETGELAEAE